MSGLNYVRIAPASRDEIVIALESGDAEASANALFSAVKYEEDWEWVEKECLKAVSSPETTVRWAAVTCLGDMAFLRRPLDLAAVIPALEIATKDPEISDPATFSLSLVRQFLVTG